MRVELDIYSGRPNPAWTLTPDEAAQLRSLLEDLPTSAEPPSLPALGYRGFLLHLREPLRIYGGRIYGPSPGDSHDQAQEANGDVERWLLERRKAQLDPATYRAALEAIGGS